MEVQMIHDIHEVDGWRAQLQRLEQELNDGAGDPDALIQVIRRAAFAPDDSADAHGNLPAAAHGNLPAASHSNLPAVGDLQPDLQLSPEEEAEIPDNLDDVFHDDEEEDEPISPITPTSNHHLNLNLG